MQFRHKSLTLSLLLALLLILALTWQSSAGEPLPSPRSNPALQGRLSGVVVFDPRDERVLALGFGAVPVGPNVVCNQDPGIQHQNEPSIVVNPDNSLHVIASSNDYRNREFGGDVHPGYYVSFDGGNTWPGDGVIDLSPIPSAEAGGDPALAIHDLNNVYFAYIAFHRTQDDVGGVYVSKSADGGLSWGAPVELAANTLSVFHDKEYIAVDATGSPYDGYVYVSWTRFGGGSPIYLSRSTDGGASFSTPFQVSDPSLNSNQGSIPAVGPNGEVYVVWYNYSTGAQRMAVSLDGGQSFGTPFHVASVNPISSPLPGASFRNNSFPTLAVDQNNGSLYVAWNDDAHGDADIFFVRSTDGGGTWSSPIRINDDLIGNDHHQFFPWLSVAPNGAVYAGWFDSRLDPNPDSEPFIYDEYVAVSTDGGLSFDTSSRISTVSSDASIGFDGGFIGDYSGIAATDTFVYPAWVDTRRGHQDIFTQASEQIVASKTAPATVDAGQAFTYTLTLSSTGTIDDNVLADPLPPGVTYASDSLWASSGSYGQAGGVVTWTGTVTAGVPVTVTFQVTAMANACTPITNTALLTDGRGFVYEALDAYTYISGMEPQAAFEPSAWALDVGQPVTLTNQSSGSEPLDFLWDSGDGETSTLDSPVHTYDLPGPYNVVLTASNTCGADLHIEELTVACDAPAAAFTWTADDLVVSFANESVGMFALDYEWHLGDGVNSLDPSPSHAYDLPGAYTVTLSAVDLCGTGVYTDVLWLEQSYILYLPVVMKR